MEKFHANCGTYAKRKETVMAEIPDTFIKRLVVKNYRSLAEIDIALQPLTVFVGKNGTGKSNLIDVMCCVLCVMRSRMAFVRLLINGGRE
jgi:predicted ATPase